MSRGINGLQTGKLGWFVGYSGADRSMRLKIMRLGRGRPNRITRCFAWGNHSDCFPFYFPRRAIIGLSLLFLRRQRIPVGLAVAAFFVAIFPGNIAQYLNHADAFGLDTDAKRFVRLFLQLPLLMWVLWSTNAWAWLRGGPPTQFPSS